MPVNGCGVALAVRSHQSASHCARSIGLHYECYFPDWFWSGERGPPFVLFSERFIPGAGGTREVAFSDCDGSCARRHSDLHRLRDRG
jgi:hypothetical protein